MRRTGAANWSHKMFVLIVIFLAGYGPRLDIHTQEFTSLENCTKAQNEVTGAWKRENASLLIKATCVAK
jgi:hypothetical protein